MGAEQTVREALARVLDGDAQAVSSLRQFGHAALHNGAAGAEPLVLTRVATVSVLRGLRAGQFSPPEAQRWASFVTHGYLEGTAGGPIRAIPIDYESAWEDAIVEAVSRLDQIGDLIDGEVSDGDVLDLLMLLGVVD